MSEPYRIMGEILTWVLPLAGVLVGISEIIYDAYHNATARKRRLYGSRTRH
jgi:hypothetical protein